MIVFLNNLLMPAASWKPCISLLNEKRAQSAPTAADKQNTIPMLTYDRFGQGATTDRDPLDARPGTEVGYGHDFLDVVHDLHELIAVVSTEVFGSETAKELPHLLLVGASIGAPLARLYAETYPGTVSGLLLIDSNIANANYSTFWPQPDSPDFKPENVTAPDCTLEQYIEATRKLVKVFDLDVKNPERLDRRTTPNLLPHADRPWLTGPGGQDVKICVVGHDPVAFATEGYKMMGTPKSFTERWSQKAWDEYNQGLLRIGDTTNFPQVLIAKGCGHFVQKDDPAFVADLIGKMLDALGW